MILDTHAFLWWVSAQARLGEEAVSAICDGRRNISVSAVSIWELGLLTKLGRLELKAPVDETIVRHVTANRFDLLDFKAGHALAQLRMPFFDDHRDPFDRMLVAQARCEGMPLISRDAAFDRYGVERVW